MSTIASAPDDTAKGRRQLGGLALLAGIIAFMWVIEAINTLDSNRLDNDGLYPRDIDRFWGIITFPFLHASFQHLIDNTVPLAFIGAIIALRGAAKLARVTLFVIVVGGVLAWVVAPSHTVTVGASGVVFGYATYVFARGFFERSLLDVSAGLVVGAVWGAALLYSIVPHNNGVSWQGHVCGAIAGVLAAWALSDRRHAGSPTGVAAI
ncbi:MAG: rhomboid family intramembrane serine protease [Solirubrobacteraceae bacterium]|jgi:membrane associated rhomboid family serine protease